MRNLKLLVTPAFLRAKRTFLVAGLLAILSLGLTGCAHSRHTGAVVGGIVGATIGYVIATESDRRDQPKHHDYKRHPNKTGYGDYGHHKPPPRDPYCR